MKYIDLFAGIGGFRYGIEKATDADCVYSSEWDRYANSVYRKHYGECDIRDIRTVNADDIPDHDLLCAGFPCQAFSIAGKRRGFDDTRGTLFYEIARILDAKKPRLCLLENVKGLLSHNNGRTIKTIIATLDELGYNTEWEVLNSKDYGVPQNRERIYIVGHLRGRSRSKVFPIERDGGVPDAPDESDQGQPPTKHSGTIRRTMYMMKADDTFIKETQKLSDALRVRSTEGNAVTLKGLGGGMGAKTGLYAVQDIRGMKKSQNGKGVKEATESYTVDTLATQGIAQGMRIRRLTPKECERLQGFPDDWTKYGCEGEIDGKVELISDTQRYKMCGNAVTTNVVTEIMKRIICE